MVVTLHLVEAIRSRWTRDRGAPRSRITIPPARHLDAGETPRTKDVLCARKGRDHDDRPCGGTLDKVGDPVPLGTITAHVVDDSSGGDHETVPRLFDAVDRPHRPVIGEDPTIGARRHRSLGPSKIRRPIDERLGAPSPDLIWITPWNPPGRLGAVAMPSMPMVHRCSPAIHCLLAWNHGGVCSTSRDLSPSEDLRDGCLLAPEGLRFDPPRSP